MTTFRIDSNDTFSTEVTVRESDKYSRAVYMRIDRHYIPEEIRGCNEVFLSVDELENLGKFLLQEAKFIRAEQKSEKNNIVE